MHGKRWADEEIEFLKKNYSSKDYTPKKIALILGRTTEAVRSQAEKLEIRVFAPEKREGFKYCPRCKEYKKTEDYCKSRKKKDGLDTYCKKCKMKLYKELEERKKLIKLGIVIDNKPKEPEVIVEKITIKEPTEQKCKTCNEIKKIKEFSKNAKNANGYMKECKKCTNERRRENKLKQIMERGW